MEEDEKLRGSIRQRILKFNTPRRIVQFLSFIFFSAIVFNLGALPLLFPVLWTWGLQQNTVGDAFTAMQLMLYNVVFPWFAVASFLTVGIVIGKSFCGWVCPFGFIQDLAGIIKRKKMRLSQRTHDFMIYIKYIILALTLIISVTFSVSKLMQINESYENALGIFAKAPFTALSPAETLFATLPKMISNFTVEVLLRPLLWVQLIILVYVLVFAVYVPRSWCRYFCPHGAIMAILNRFSFIGLRRDPVKCAKGGCRVCVEVCPMNIRILDLTWEKFSDPECIYCMKCVDACENKAIRLKYP